MLDILIKNGMIFDGTGNPWYKADVSIYKNKIYNLGKIDENAHVIIDAEELAVAPGFIDTHSHSDLVLISEPDAKPKIMQGVTTEIVGQDGLGEAPIRDNLVKEWRKYLSGLNGDPEINWTWSNIGEYLDRLESVKPAVNVATLVGHGNLRILTVGMENRSSTPNELKDMKCLLSESIKHGAFGLSTGLIYPPCVYSDTYELIELCKVVSKHGGVFVVHMRNEGNLLLESIEEVVRIGKKSRVSIHISHFKCSGKANWGKVHDAIKKVSASREKGIDITVDQYPYIAGSTFMSSLLPVWVHEGGTDRMLERLKDGNLRKKVLKEMMEIGRGVDWGWDNILITSVNSKKNKIFEGMNLRQIAQKRDQNTLETLLNIIVEEENAVTMVSFSMSEENVRTIMQSPFQMFCTDGIVLGKPHPRAYGSFPRVLGRYVKSNVLRLEEAIRKMTSLPAQRFGLIKRGIIRPGMHADIVIFNPDKIIDTATYNDPIRFPSGIEYVIVNGKISVESGEFTGIRAGQILRHEYETKEKD